MDGKPARPAVLVPDNGEAIIEQSTPITNPPAPTPPRRWRWPLLLMTAAMVYYVAGVLTLATHRRGEVEPVLFARLLATGHMAEFIETVEQRRPPSDQWVRASEWQRFEQPQDRWIFRQIARESGRYEAHPPFFFWLMHIALLLGVGEHWVTTLFNLPAAVLTGGLVAWLAWRVTRDEWTAALAAACWFLSPPVMVIGDSVRSPTLFAPLTLLLVWLTLDWARARLAASLARRARGDNASQARPLNEEDGEGAAPSTPPRGKWLRCVGVVVLSVLGMLNHFQMAVAIAGCGAYLLLRDRRAFVLFFASAVVAAGLFLAIDPYAPQSLAFNAKVNRVMPVTPRNVGVRVARVGIGLLHFLAMEPKWTRVITLAIPLTIFAAWLRGRRRGAPLTPGQRPGPAAESGASLRRESLVELAGLTAVLFGLDTLLFVTWRLPEHAYGAYYFPGLIVLTPLWLAIGLRFVVRTPAIRAVLVAVLAVSSLGSARRTLQHYAAAGLVTDTIAAADLIVTDAVHIHGVPRIVGPARPDAWVRTTTRGGLPAVAAEAIATGRRVVVVVGDTADLAPDGLRDYVAAAVARGDLVRQRGLEPFSPEFEVYRTP